MPSLRGLPNIGKKLEERLADVDIKSSQELIDLILFVLWRVQFRWHDLSKETKEELQVFYSSLK